MPISYFEKTTDVAFIVEALRRDGAVVVKNLADDSVIDATLSELRPKFDTRGSLSQSDLNGTKTSRYSTSTLTAAPSAVALVDHDMVLDVANSILLPHCASFQIGSLSAIEIQPGESGQAMHRDDSCWPIEIAGMELQIGVMWALNDFTEENGATRFVPGSHRYLRTWHLPNLSDWEAAVMPKGSALFYMGSTWHGGGANNSTAPRAGLINTYSLGWLRGESNLYLHYPPEVAAQFEPRMRALLGYAPHGIDSDLGIYCGDCPAMVEQSVVPEWRETRGQVPTAEIARLQSSD